MVRPTFERATRHYDLLTYIRLLKVEPAEVAQVCEQWMTNEKDTLFNDYDHLGVPSS
jgi:hypothetical protein